MKVYLAGRPRYADNFKAAGFDYYRLESYYYINDNGAADIPKYKDFILDSGVFTYLNSKKKHDGFDWEAYATKYADFVKKHNIKNYVEIDVDSFIGLDEVERLRGFLEKRVGWKPMPVWHLNRGWDKWAEICRDYDYVCFGAFITDGMLPSQYEIVPKFIQEANKHDCKVHGLGFTSFENLKKMKFYSVDSSTWTIGNRFGSVFTIKNGLIKNNKRPEGCRVSNHKALEAHNLNVWIQYSKYAEHNF